METLLSEANKHKRTCQNASSGCVWASMLRSVSASLKAELKPATDMMTHQRTTLKFRILFP